MALPVSAISRMDLPEDYAPCMPPMLRTSRSGKMPSVYEMARMVSAM
jgi:hypothetical protein